ncbi:MAG: bacillithiol biosynthesis deacetylase BshB1 [Candidatus Kapabacteria bacterium]|nr:bacillithiol biosynthesis deacetylase BshB1 [Candidatus Kapabacteria bacterium]
MNTTHVDVLAIGAHPDDIEMSMGGTVAKLVAEGKRVALVDCTRGEMGSRGTREIRDAESVAAATILGASYRENLDMPDGFITQSDENVERLIRVIRAYRPRIMVFNPAFERHPDHEQVHRLCRTAYFKSGMSKIITHHNGIEQAPHRPAQIFTYIQSYHQEPDFAVDISDFFDIKIASIEAHASQVFVQGGGQSNEPQTLISTPGFMEMLRMRDRYLGEQTGVRFAEGFKRISMLGIPTMSIWL